MERAKSWERAERVAANREAQRHLREARALVAEGFSDPLGLAAASFGWEARAALLTKDFSNAITLYLAQHAAGDASAVPSLQRAARSAVDSYPRDYEALVREPMVRRVVTAYFIARGLPRYGEPGPVPEQLKAWAIALEQADIGAVPDADRIAWLAYEAGLFALAQRWADIAPIDSPEAHWIRAKLALRSGNLRGGEKFLRTALESLRLGEAHRARINAELGRVCLAQDDFSGALSAALNGGHWEDAAFVAEKVMTLADLEAFVDRAVALKPEIILNSSWGRPENLTAALRHLLARRLARAGKAERAENYFSPEMRATYHAYVIAVQNGFDVTKPTAVRAEAFWNAAKIVRKDGMQLLGTELEPDWRIWEGLFETDPSAKARRNGPGNQGGVFAPTSVELTRLEKQTAPAKRFHYRYRAAELAWWSASLLPNDSDETAQILATAGGWLKARDPQAAQPFYQALVIRCGNTALGRAAATKHWFPAPPGPSGQ